MKPTNITLLNPKTTPWKLMSEIKSTDITEGTSLNLHPEGLYSVEIFGRIGSDARETTEAYIDVRVPIFNPTYYNTLIKLKALYAGIIKGHEYAIWDSSQKDFIKSNILEGKTGFAFFMEHFEELKPKTTESFTRDQRLELVKKFGDIALTTKVIVLPAGQRDIEFRQDGSMSDPEINELYRKLIFKARAVVVDNLNLNNPMYDNVRFGIQQAFLDIDNYIGTLQDSGKKGFNQREIATRGVVGGTRNVITARRVSTPDADVYNGVDLNSTDIGLFQGMMSFQYVCKFAILNSYLDNVFTQGSPTAKLVDPKTFSYAYVDVTPDVVDKWTSSDGLTKLFNGFSNSNLRGKSIMINGHFLALIYDDGEVVKMFGDISELPDGFDKKFVKPITYMQFFYYTCCEEIEKRMAQLTRYPIIGEGSIYASKVNLKTTSDALPRYRLDEMWEKTDYRYNNFPKGLSRAYFDAMSVDPCRYPNLDADNDGDQLNENGINSEDSIKEIKNHMGKRSTYISGTGNFRYAPFVEPNEFLFKALSSGLD